MEFLHKDSWRYYSPTGTELAQPIHDFIFPTQDVQVLDAIEIVFQLVKLLTIHHHLVVQT
jgi:hypothetical protein